MSMYPLVERELRWSADLRAPSFIERCALHGVEAIELPAEIPDIDGHVERALRGGFPDVAWRERSALHRGVWPQSYIVDTWLAGAAAGVGVRVVLEDSDLLGRYFDAFGTALLHAEAAFMQARPAPLHLRAEAGRHAVDLVVEMGARRLLGFEFKAGVAPDARDARHLVSLRDRLGTDCVRGAVLHSGTSIYPLSERTFAVPLCAISA